MVPRSIRRFVPVLFFLILCPVAFLLIAAPEEATKRYALLIGVNDYDHADLSKLDWAVNDVAELRDVLVKGGYEVVLLTADEARAKTDRSLAPTRANFDAHLKAIVQKFAKGDTLLIGLAGHGLQFEDDEDGYFCPVDARPFQDYTKTLVSIKGIYDRLKKDAAAGVKLLLVDACRNLTSKPKTRSGINARGAPPPPDGIGVLLSCKAGQTAQERDNYKHGVFFYHLLKGLKGEAKDRKGHVTWASLKAYVMEEVVLDRHEQTPEEAGRLAGIPPVLLAARTGSDTPDPIKTEVREEKPKTLTLGLDGVKLELVRIEKGIFQMGATLGDKDARENEKPRHEVEISKPFYLGKYHVTRGQFRAFAKDTNYKTEAEKGDGVLSFNAEKGSFEKSKDYNWKNIGFTQTDEHPVVGVSWNDAVAFCDWLSDRTGAELSRKMGGRWRVKLPTEAQWEYACRAGSAKRFHFGDDEEDLANYANVADASLKKKLPEQAGIQADDGYVVTAPDGKFRSNEWGLHDMHGNAWQWCEDYYEAKFYGNSDRKDPVNLQQSSARVLRGGSWSVRALFCRAAYRSGSVPLSRSHSTGFRVAVRQD